MQQLARWHQTKRGLVTFGVIELATAYGFASLAIDHGSWWGYGFALVSLVGAAQNFTKLAGKALHR